MKYKNNKSIFLYISKNTYICIAILGKLQTYFLCESVNAILYSTKSGKFQITVENRHSILRHISCGTELSLLRLEGLPEPVL